MTASRFWASGGNLAGNELLAGLLECLGVRVVLLGVQFELLAHLTHEPLGGKKLHHGLPRERHLRLLPRHTPEDLLEDTALSTQLAQGAGIDDIRIGDAAPIGAEPLLDFAHPLIAGCRSGQFHFHISIVRRYGGAVGGQTEKCGPR
jgi:hypothetical protein